MGDREGGSGITRRQFVDGAGLAIGALAMPAMAAGKPAIPAGPAETYPPMMQGIRGQTDESFAVAHAIRDGQRFPAGEDSAEHYDLVIVGAGMSGLAAAYFYRKALPHAKILIVEACDDLGGHARRNEFEVDGHKLLGKGGTFSIMYPNTYTPAGKQLLRDIGIDPKKVSDKAAEDAERHAGLGLGTAVFFDKASYGRDMLVGGYPDFSLGGSYGQFTGEAAVKAWRDFAAASPLPAAARADLVRIAQDARDHFPGLDLDARIARLKNTSYADYLKTCLGAGPELLRFIQNQVGSWVLNVGAGPDSFSAWLAYQSHLPGFAGMKLPPQRISDILPDEDVGAHADFPDGNGTVARLLARWLIPDSVPGGTMEDSIGARVRYDALDRPCNDVRIRLNATVTQVRHDGDFAWTGSVLVSYVRDGKASQVRAGVCVLACFNAVVPHICPELPAPQKEALALAVRKPLVWTAVALRHWRPFARRKVAMFYAPGCFYHLGMLDTGRSFGGAFAARSPDDPAILYLLIAPNAPGLSQRDQFKAGRTGLMEIDRATYERHARDQLQRAFGSAGFDARRDIAGITINRWAHGYAGGLNELYDPPADAEPSFVRARRRFGRITIANSDAGGVPLTQVAFDQANRAVQELLWDVVRPGFYNSNPERG